MARWAHAVPTWTPDAAGIADATNFNNDKFDCVQGGISTQRGEIREIYLGGQAGASSPTFMVFGRDVVVGGTPAGVTRLASLDPSTVALVNPPIVFTQATTKPQRSTTKGILLNLSFNAYGGIVRWYAGPDEVISYLGNATDLGELSLSAFTGGTSGLLGSNIVFEVL